MDWKNRLYFGDNLDILRRQVPDACVDLIYLDPPFNSNATYDLLFKKGVARGPWSGPFALLRAGSAAFQLFPARRVSLVLSPKSQLAQAISRSHDNVRSRLWGYENPAFGRDDC